MPAVSGELKRIAKDVEQARALIKKLDAEKGVEGNILTQENQNIEGDRSLSGTAVGPIVIVRGGNQVKGYEGVELLDIMLTYLWRVHSVDYYGGIELKEAAKGNRHVRKDGKAAEEPGSVSGADWEKNTDSTWQARLQGRDPIESMLGREKLETAANEALDSFVRKIKDEKYGWKYGCGAKGCTKLFHGPEYVHKHLKLKHPELVGDVIAKSRQELYFQNYMRYAHLGRARSGIFLHHVVSAHHEPPILFSPELGIYIFSDRDAPGVSHNGSHQSTQVKSSALSKNVSVMVCCLV